MYYDLFILDMQGRWFHVEGFRSYRDAMNCAGCDYPGCEYRVETN